LPESCASGSGALALAGNVNFFLHTELALTAAGLVQMHFLQRRPNGERKNAGYFLINTRRKGVGDGT
jgi:hypothetical protein